MHSLELFINLYLFLIPFSSAFFQHDDLTTTIVYDPFKIIEFETSQISLSYKINLEIINSLQNEQNNFKIICKNSSQLSTFLYHFNHNATWNRILSERGPGDIIIEYTPYQIQKLEANYYLFQQSTNLTTKCDFLQYINDNLFILNVEFEKLHRESLSTLPTLIPPEKILYDLSHILRHPNLINFSNPIDLKQWFIRNFFNFSSFAYVFTRNDIYLSFIIPLYSNTTLYKIYPKPLFYDSSPYLFNTNSTFMVKNQPGINYFQTASLKERCFMAKNKTFCKKPLTLNLCDTKYLSNKFKRFDNACFKPLNVTNKITQINRDIYFLPLTPINVSFQCKQSNDTIIIIRPLHIANNTCNITTDFFAFNSSIKYKIFESDYIENPLTSDYHINNKYGFMILLITMWIYLIVLCTKLGLHIIKIRCNSPNPLESIV